MSTAFCFNGTPLIRYSTCIASSSARFNVSTVLQYIILFPISFITGITYKGSPPYLKQISLTATAVKRGERGVWRAAKKSKVSNFLNALLFM